MSLQAVLFDLDDTLIDRDESLRRFATALASEYAQRLTTADPVALYPIVRSADGGGYQPRARVAEDLALLLPWKNAPTSTELASFWDTRFPSCSQPTDGLVEVLGRLRQRDLKTGIVTNGRVTAQGKKIALLGLDALVDTVVISEAVGVWKPDSRIFDIALDRLNVARSEAWFVGDNPMNDVLGATAAGLTAIWFRRDAEWPVEHPRPALSITSLRQIVGLLSPKDGGQRAVRRSHLWRLNA